MIVWEFYNFLGDLGESKVDLFSDQLTTYFSGILPSEFYVTLGDRNLENFKPLLWKSIIVVFTKSFVGLIALFQL